MCLSTVMARIHPVYHVRNAREAVPEPQRHRYRGRSRGNNFVNNVLVPKAIGFGAGLILAGLLTQNNGK